MLILDEIVQLCKSSSKLAATPIIHFTQQQELSNYPASTLFGQAGDAMDGYIAACMSMESFILSYGIVLKES